MTDDEAATAMNELAQRYIGDTEDAHGRGDDLVAEVLRKHGFPKLADAYDSARQTWWYA